jgi:hypothetical protein
MLGTVVRDRYVGTLRRLLGDAPADEVSPDLAAELRRPMVAVFVVVIPTIFVAILFLMVVKPNLR